MGTLPIMKNDGGEGEARRLLRGAKDTRVPSPRGVLYAVGRGLG